MGALLPEAAMLLRLLLRKLLFCKGNLILVAMVAIERVKRYMCRICLPVM